MKIKYDIPSTLIISRFKIEIFYFGQPQTCWRCGMDHRKGDNGGCTTEYKDFINKFSLSDFPPLNETTIVPVTTDEVIASMRPNIDTTEAQMQSAEETTTENTEVLVQPGEVTTTETAEVPIQPGEKITAENTEMLVQPGEETTTGDTVTIMQPSENIVETKDSSSQPNEETINVLEQSVQEPTVPEKTLDLSEDRVGTEVAQVAPIEEEEKELNTGINVNTNEDNSGIKSNHINASNVYEKKVSDNEDNISWIQEELENVIPVEKLIINDDDYYMDTVEQLNQSNVSDDQITPAQVCPLPRQSDTSDGEGTIQASYEALKESGSLAKDYAEVQVHHSMNSPNVSGVLSSPAHSVDMEKTLTAEENEVTIEIDDDNPPLFTVIGKAQTKKRDLQCSSDDDSKSNIVASFGTFVNSFISRSGEKIKVRKKDPPKDPS